MYCLDNAERALPGNHLSFMLHEVVFLGYHSLYASYQYSFASYSYISKFYSHTLHLWYECSPIQYFSPSVLLE